MIRIRLAELMTEHSFRAGHGVKPADAIVSEDQMARLLSSETAADVCMSLPHPSQAVDLTEAQMLGVQGDIDVPTRRY
ncbi:hypothetical protein [Roseateles oligotrophus]|uniref:Uncharacterized protein n=1 Tax=Roseateles oligotrophus TaxID=1769250 RepID=A0ABT2YC92_9BURK|nr:hypothetical protein [Roseateles oligotrophus]MCV2367664.1 hypothetical protein [Roseateles oligotrophus]